MSEQEQMLDLAEWVEQTLLIMEYPARQGGAFCAKWWLHPEAVARFKALRRQYYKAMQDDDISSWWITHWDGHAKALFDPQTGVFSGLFCDASSGGDGASTRCCYGETG